MTLNELKILLGIPKEDTSQDELLTLLLEAAIDFAMNWTQNSFTTDESGNIVLPAGMKPAIASMISAVMESGGGGSKGNSTIESERVGPMAQTFRNPSEIWSSGGQYGATAPWFAMMKPYRRIRFVPSRSPFCNVAEDDEDGCTDP